MTFKKLLFILIILPVKCYLFAQDKIDSALKNIQLNEVIICSDNKNQQNDAFNFYRSSKIATTEDILSRIEGVNLIRRGAFGTEPMLRTYSAGQINIMVNGMRMYGACTDKMDPISSYIEPGNLAKLQVTQGAGAALNGSTVGGSINFQLKEASFHCHNLPVVNVFSQFSSVNKGFNNGFNVNVNNNKIAFRLAGTYRNVGNYNAGNGKEIYYTQYEKYNIQFNSAIKIGAKNSLIIDIIIDKGFNIGYASLPMDVKSASANIYSFTHRYIIKKLNNAMLETKLYYNDVIHNMDDTNRPETLIHMDMPGWSNTIGFYSKINYENRKHNLQIRTDAHKAFTRADMTMYPKNENKMYMQTLPGNDLLNSGIAFQYAYNINKLYTIGIATRQDYFKQTAITETGILQWQAFGFNINNAATNWLNSSSIWIEKKQLFIQSKLVLAAGSRLPTGNERMGFYLFNRADGYDYIGNYNLSTEHALQIDFINNFTVKKTAMNATFFYHHVNNYIYAYKLTNYSAMTIGARGVKTYNNIDFANIMGFEYSLAFKMYKKIFYKGNMRYTYGLLSNNLNMQQVPPLKILNTFRFQNDSIQIQLEHIFAATQNLINTDFGEVKTNSWQTFNLRISYMKNIGNSVFQLNAAVENIFNTNYREHLDWGNIPQPGRNFVIGLNYYLN